MGWRQGRGAALPGSWAVEDFSNNRQIISLCAAIEALQTLMNWRAGRMIGWLVIGLLGRLPHAAHDGVSEVFSTEKREGVAASGCLALRHAPPVPSPRARCPE